MTDKEKILTWFDDNPTLTCAQAIHELGVYNLRSRASEMGLKSTIIDVVRRDGKLTKVARYSIWGDS